MEKTKQLELKNLAAYLPYGFTCLIDQQIVFIAGAYNLNNKLNVVSDAGNDFDTSIWAVKPILKPLSDLLNPEFRQLAHDLGADIDYEAAVYDIQRGWTKQHLYEKLLEKHFDTRGLIDAGLAMGINTLNK